MLATQTEIFLQSLTLLSYFSDVKPSTHHSYVVDVVDTASHWVAELESLQTHPSPPRKGVAALVAVPGPAGNRE